MQIRFIRLIDDLFRDVPQTRQTLEMKEEIVQNLMEKFHDLCTEGKSEEEAFKIAAESIGDINDLLSEMPEAASAAQPSNATGDARQESIAPDEQPSAQSPAMNWAQTICVATVLVILAPIVAKYFRDWRGLSMMLLLTCGAIGLIIYQMMKSKPKASFLQMENGDESTREDEGEGYWEHQRFALTPEAYAQRRKVYKSLSSALWLMTVSAYVLFSFMFGQWHISWVIFLLASAGASILKASYGLTRYTRAINSAFWNITVVLYFLISFATDAWHLTWIVFLIATAMKNVLHAAIDVRKGR